MAINLQELRERRSDRAQALHTLLEDNPGDKWSTELNDQYDAGMAEIDDIDNEIGRHEKLLKAMTIEAETEEVADNAERVAKDKKSKSSELFAKWLRGGDNALSAQDWADVRATMTTTTDAEGGYSVQSDVAQQLIDQLAAFGGMRAMSTILTTAQGNPLSFPTSDGTSETGELIAENTTATGADPTFGTVGLNVYKFSSKIVAAPIELLQDSQVDIEAFIGNRLAQRIGRSENAYFTTGTGTSQPKGIVTGAGAGKTGATGQTTSVIFDDLVDLVHSVDPAYRVAPNVGFMMADSSLKVIKKLKDSNGRPIFLPGYAGLSGPMADSLLGYSVTVNQDVAAMAANAKSILFGDLAQYYIRDVMQATLYRFTDSAYTKLGQVGFLMWARSGGNLIDTAAVKYYANSAT